MEEMMDENVKNGINTRLILGTQWPANLTMLDLCNKSISNLDSVNFPENLLTLNLKNNKLKSVPVAVLKLQKLEVLDISSNQIVYFDEIPQFCHHIKDMNVANNELKGPPYWVFAENPKSLTKLDLSGNTNITNAFKVDLDYYEEILHYTSSVTDLKIFNCRLIEYQQLLQCFPKLKHLELGCSGLQRLSSNYSEQIPHSGMVQLSDLEEANFCNLQVYCIEANIDVYKNLREIDLSHNNLTGLPREFCNLEKLEVCILSSNNILYLPDDMGMLKKLERLYLDLNELCMVPLSLCSLTELKVLDLYHNSLYEVPNRLLTIAEVDIAQNHMEEPVDEDYMKGKELLRLNTLDRFDGRKEEVVYSPSEHSNNTIEDDELMEWMKGRAENNNDSSHSRAETSSPEDWDSDDYWVPTQCRTRTSGLLSPWLSFVHRKMEEGNFCPMDIHSVSVYDQVKYEKICNPTEFKPVPGQFDDCTDDDS